MAQRGGKRPGAGRKKGFAAVEAEKQRQLLVERLAPHVEEIVAALAEKAKSGDVAAAKELFDRAWGKATQTVEVEDKRTLIV